MTLRLDDLMVNDLFPPQEENELNSRRLSIVTSEDGRNTKDILTCEDRREDYAAIVRKLDLSIDY